MISEETIINLPPRPDFVRLPMEDLHGSWNLRYDPKNIGLQQNWQTLPIQDFNKSIIVPYPIESEASQINDQHPPDVFWYSRIVTVDKSKFSKHVLIHFGAIDYNATVFWNGQQICSHIGGYSGFGIPLKQSLIKEHNQLTIRVEDAKTSTQPRGKQTSLKDSWTIFYRQISGIWQSVWIEAIDDVFISNAFVSIDNPTQIQLNLELTPYNQQNADSTIIDNLQIEVEIYKDIKHDGSWKEYPIYSQCITKQKLPLKQLDFSSIISCGDVPLWSPDAPNMIGVKCHIYNHETIIDTIFVTSGLRQVSTNPTRILVNDQPVYLKFLLNQGYYPQGWYRPVTSMGYYEDLQALLECGFNGLRMHQKIEDPIFLYLCDRLGILVWEEMPSPSFFRNITPDSFFSEWTAIIKQNRNHPCIICRVVFNESWGVLPIIWSKKTRSLLQKGYELTKQLDPQVLCIDNSGYEHLRTDIVDIHHYLGSTNGIKALYHKLKKPATIAYRKWRALYLVLPTKVYKSPLLPHAHITDQPVVVSEMGGHGFFHKVKTDWLSAIKQSLQLIKDQPHLAGFCYTQQYDVEQERNGLYHFDRTPKINQHELQEFLNSFTQE